MIEKEEWILVLVGAFILPHGSMILNPEKKNLPQGAKDLHYAMQKVRKLIENLNAELCVLITPHGFCLNEDFGLYFNEKAAGTAEWEGEYKEYQVEVQLNRKLTQKLFNDLKEEGIPVSTIVSYTSNAAFPLRWGEVVPLYFLKKISLNYMIISIPTRRYEHGLEMIPELQTMGKFLKDFIENLEERIIVIISADLAHTHSHDGPYSFSTTAAQFDNYIEEYIKTQEETFLLEKAGNILNQALACGFAGIVISQQLLLNSGLQAKILIRNHPSYYGMMIVTYI